MHRAAGRLIIVRWKNSTTSVRPSSVTAAIGRLKDDHPRERRSTDQYSRVNVMDVEYMPGDSDWKLVAKIFPYNVTI